MLCGSIVCGGKRVNFCNVAWHVCSEIQKMSNFRLRDQNLSDMSETCQVFCVSITPTLRVLVNRGLSINLPSSHINRTHAHFIDARSQVTMGCVLKDLIRFGFSQWQTQSLSGTHCPKSCIGSSAETELLFFCDKTQSSSSGDPRPFHIYIYI
jgi:hypothetical protein